MKKVLKICVVVAVIAMTGTTMAALDINSPMTFITNGQPDLVLAFNYLPDYAATQDGTMINVDDSNFHLIISSVDPGGAENIVVSWEIVDITDSGPAVLAGTMENFLFWDENNNIPSGTSGSVFSSADYATSGAWQGVGNSAGAWSGTYDGNPTWSGTVVITPEPATMALLGLGGLLLRRKRA